MTPKFRLKAKERKYECDVCGHTQMIMTNHTERCFNYCENCSIQGLEFGAGYEMGIEVHRLFRYIGNKK
jgi:transcription elongation factor Elf1